MVPGDLTDQCRLLDFCRNVPESAGGNDIFPAVHACRKGMHPRGLQHSIHVKFFGLKIIFWIFKINLFLHFFSVSLPNCIPRWFGTVLWALAPWLPALVRLLRAILQSSVMSHCRDLFNFFFNFKNFLNIYF